MSNFWEGFKKAISILCLTVCSTISCTLLIAFFIISYVATPICGWTLTQGLLVIVPIILDIAGTIIALTGVGIPVTAVLLVISTIMEVISVVCDFLSGRYLEVFLGVLGWIPIAGIPPQIFRGIWKLIT